MISAKVCCEIFDPLDVVVVDVEEDEASDNPDLMVELISYNDVEYFRARRSHES